MIMGVAIKQGDITVCLPKPHRHCDCIMLAIKVLRLSPPVGSPAEHQGFYLADGSYLNRADALLHAREHNQLINPEAHAYLFSEDLW